MHRLNEWSNARDTETEGLCPQKAYWMPDLVSRPIYAIGECTDCDIVKSDIRNVMKKSQFVNDARKAVMSVMDTRNQKTQSLLPRLDLFNYLQQNDQVPINAWSQEIHWN